MTQGIKERDIRDFEKYANKLVDVMRRIKQYKPEANAYLAEDSLNLMSDVHHDWNANSCQENIVTTVYMPFFDGGDW